MRENCQKASFGAQVIMAPSNFTAVKIKKEKITPIKAPRVDSLVSSTLQRVKAEKKSPKPVKVEKKSPKPVKARSLFLALKFEQRAETDMETFLFFLYHH